MPDQPKPNFWTTIPGMLTGAASLIVAITGLLTFLAVNQIPPFAAGTPSPRASAALVGEDWPPYPGVATVGETGRTALVWQAILIRCGALSDIEENQDGVYGRATGRKVQEIETHWGWDDADSTADRLTYNRITESGCA